MKKRLLCFLLPGILAFAGLFVMPQNAFAIPVENPDSTVVVPDDETGVEDGGVEEAGEMVAGEEPKTCYDQVGAIGWMVCPATGLLGTVIDALYGAVQSLLQVNPVSMEQDSPIYLVWEYIRNLTNIVFIILLLVVIFSQLTGAGMNNYGIKRVLPRIAVAAILVNLGFILCVLAVDVSNILGGSLREVFVGIQEMAIANGAINSVANFSLAEFIGVALGTVAVGAGAGIATFAIAGPGVFWMLLPIVFAGAVALIAAFITLAARQALILLLIMVSPLAFVAYLLPNTEPWFKKWRDLFVRMLVFYPMFSVLFGASQLAGWVIMAAAANWTGVVLGIAVQLLPLFFTWPLMKMSGTVLGKVNEAVRKPFAPAQGALKDFSRNRMAVSKAEYTRKALSRGPNRLERRLGRKIVNPLSASSWRAYGANLSARTADRKQRADEDVNALTNERLNARKLGQEIIGYDKEDGSAIYSTRPVKENKHMKQEYAHRVTKLRAENVAADLDKSMGAMGNYLEENRIDTSKGLAAQIKALTDQQGQNFLESETIRRAVARNAMTDKRYYYESVLKAEEDKDSEAYQRLVVRGAGADGMSDDAKIRNDARTSLVADAYDMFEAERKVLRDKYVTYFTKQKTKDALTIHQSNLDTQNIDGIVAMHEVLGFRGDFDKIGEMLQQKMDAVPNYVELGSDFANTLASSLLGMKDRDPTLARLGKHINMETWRYSNDPNERASYVTMKEFITGMDDLGNATRTGGALKLLEGTPLQGIERTAFGNLQSLIGGADYFANDLEKKTFEDKLTKAMMPQLITAIPSFTSGSEQIVNTVSYITGLNYNDGQWENKKRDPVTKAAVKDLEPRFEMTRQYLGGMTTHDVIGMKTDAFNGTIKALEYAHNGDAVAARAEFRQIQIDNGNIAKLQAIVASGSGADSTMKKSVREALGLPPPPTP